MIKINKKYLTIYIFLLILILALTGCSKNPVTDNYGPSWDMMLELPVTEQENKLSDIAEADEFDNMGFTTNADSIENIFVIGTEENPIVKNLSLDLPELTADLGSEINIKEEGVPIQNGSGSLPSITLELPDMTFGSTGNILTFEISNSGANKIDKISIELWDKNADRSSPLDTITFSELAINSSKSKNLVLNNKVVKEDNLELRFIDEQNSGSTTADFNISGLKTITIKKVENLEVTGPSIPGFENLTVELGIFKEIKTLDNGEARLELAIDEPETMNFDFVFNSIKIDGVSGDKDGNIFRWTENSDNTTNGITLGDVSIDGEINPPDDKISYDATDHANVAISIVGEASYDSSDNNDDLPEELQDIDVENGDLIYKTEPTEVDISQEDIDTMRDGVIDLEQTYLETIIDNNTGMELAAEIYIGSTNDKTNLYTAANKVNEKLLEVTVDENDPKRFLLKNTIDKVEKTLTEGNVYMGIKFLAGDFDDDKTNFDFSTNASLNIKSSVFVKVRVNQ